ncbi:MAG: hypothetical protein WAZ48_15150 [Lysobacteraceae bacterium]
MTSKMKIEKVQEFLSHIYSVFEKKPGMLGKPAELPSMLWVADCISDILRDDAIDQDRNGLTWNSFLIEKKLLVGAENKLTKILSNDDYEFSYLQELRREYCTWKESKLLHNEASEKKAKG